MELAPAYVSLGNILYSCPCIFILTGFQQTPGMKTDLENKHKNNNYVIRDLIQILKYWNVNNGKVYSSYELKKFVTRQNIFGSCTNLKITFIQQ